MFGVVDVSFLNTKLKKGSSQDYGFLVDQLEIKESSLSSDGKLSPGDYQLLASEAQKLYAHPGLSPAQRSNIEVKIASYKSKSKSTGLKDTNDISRLNREVDDDVSKIGLRFSNSPEKFLQAQATLLVGKIERLSESVDQLQSAGDDASQHQNELNAALSEYQNTLQALDDVENYKTGSPTSNYAAYVTTNAKGEVVNLKIDRIGAASGYTETNGVYGGLPMYGKINRKEYGKNVFILGNQTYSASDVVVPGPDGSMKSSVLIESSMQKKGKGFSISESGYVDVDLNNVKSQSAVRSGGWVEGDKGFLYQRKEDGTYKKYVNAKKEDLQIGDGDIIKLPRSMLDGIEKSATETIDWSAQPTVPTPAAMAAPNTEGATAQALPSGDQQTIPQGTGRPNTGGAPTERAPQDAKNIAGKALKVGGGVLRRIFLGY